MKYAIFQKDVYQFTGVTMRPGDIGWMPRVTEVATGREQYRAKEEPPHRRRRKKKVRKASQEAGSSSIGDTGRHIDLRV